MAELELSNINIYDIMNRNEEENQKKLKELKELKTLDYNQNNLIPNNLIPNNNYNTTTTNTNTTNTNQNKLYETYTFNTKTFNRNTSNRNTSNAEQENKLKQTKLQEKIQQEKIKSTEFNTNFEKVFQDELNNKYKITYHGIFNLKTEDIEKFSNSKIITDYITKKIKVREEQVNVVEYQSPADILLDGQLENGAIEINIDYDNINLFNNTILLDDYKYGSTVEDKREFIKDFIPKMKEYYISCLAHIFEELTLKQ